MRAQFLQMNTPKVTEVQRGFRSGQSAQVLLPSSVISSSMLCIFVESIFLNYTDNSRLCLYYTKPKAVAVKPATTRKSTKTHNFYDVIS
jgi:hypothetical protein